MFTGIIEEIGKVSNIATKSIEIEAHRVLEGTKLGDSISVNGVCLTVANISKDSFLADISPETVKITTFANIKSGSFVNLERAMPANGRFGGHIVSGHIDGKAKCIDTIKTGSFYELTFELENNLSKYIVKKGSVAVNGISLTVAEINEDLIKIAIIPHTYENTTLKYLKMGDFVNIETDILAKHVEKFLSTRDNRSGINYNLLQTSGFME